VQLGTNQPLGVGEELFDEAVDFRRAVLLKKLLVPAFALVRSADALLLIGRWWDFSARDISAASA
jgi:hypothetical protein